MKRTVVLGIISIIIYSAVKPEFCAAGSVGTTGAQILEIIPAVRARGMANAFCAIADDACAVFYNPAGLAQVPEMELAMGMNTLFENIDHSYMEFVYNLGDVKTLNIEHLGTIAFTWNTLNTHDITGRDADGNFFGTFSAKEQVLIGSYGKTLVNHPRAGVFMAGVNAKFYDERLYTTHASGNAFDYGLLWKCPGYHIRVGAAVQNQGAKTAYARQDEPLPTLTSVGISAGMFDDVGLLALDYKKPKHAAAGIAVGLEYNLLNTFVLRMGYDPLMASGGAGVAMGIGMSLKEVDAYFFYAREICVDYTFIPITDLGNEHWLNLTLKLGVY